MGDKNAPDADRQRSKHAFQALRRRHWLLSPFCPSPQLPKTALGTSVTCSGWGVNNYASDTGGIAVIAHLRAIVQSIARVSGMHSAWQLGQPENCEATLHTSK